VSEDPQLASWSAKLTPVQRQAIAKADAAMAPALELYAERNKLAVRIYRLPLRDLRRLNALLDRISDDDARQIAVYAESLAEWSDPVSPSRDEQAEGASI
jgi:hypothetical protein